MSAWLSLTRRLNVRAHGCTRCTECSTGHCPMCYECPNKQKNELQGVMGKWAPYGHIPGDGNAIMQAIDALRDAITSRDRHFDALAEQLRQGFQSVQRQTEEDRAAVQGQIEALGAQLEGIERQLETVVHQLARLGLFDVIAARLTAIEAQLTESKRPRKQAGRKKAKR